MPGMKVYIFLAVSRVWQFFNRGEGVAPAGQGRRSFGKLRGFRACVNNAFSNIKLLNIVLEQVG